MIYVGVVVILFSNCDLRTLRATAWYLCVRVCARVWVCAGVYTCVCVFVCLCVVPMMRRALAARSLGRAMGAVII